MTVVTYRLLNSIEGYQCALADLFQRCVKDGASLGFLPHEPAEYFQHYWAGVAQDIQKEKTYLWATFLNENLVGTVQLVRATKANALHRAEIEKLMVHPKARQQGIAFTLLELVEQYAKQIGLSLLVLDTRTGDVSEQLYRKFGFEYAGLIPKFALSHTGSLEATTLFYKILK
jgi:acetyltransferase